MTLPRAPQKRSQANRGPPDPPKRKQGGGDRERRDRYDSSKGKLAKGGLMPTSDQSGSEVTLYKRAVALSIPENEAGEGQGQGQGPSIQPILQPGLEVQEPAFHRRPPPEELNNLRISSSSEELVNVSDESLGDGMNNNDLLYVPGNKRPRAMPAWKGQYHIVHINRCHR